MKSVLCLCLVSLAVLTTAQKRRVNNYLHDGNNKFSAKLFYEVTKSKPDENIVLSAFSVMTPLAQLTLASVGESHDELLNAIGLPSDNIIKAAFLSVNSKLRRTRGVTLNTASKIYIAKNYRLNDEFAAITRNTFGTEVQNIDFNQQQNAASEINAWVEEQTNNRIKDLVSPDSLSGDTRALLVNAIYFKGTWKKAFDKEATEDRDFYVTKNVVKQIPTMYSKDFYKYANSYELNAHVLEIDYEGEESSSVFVLPREIDGIKMLKEKLKNSSILDKVLQHMTEAEVEVFLPKFRIETTTDLKEMLPKVNVTRLFSPEDARLDNLIQNTGNLYVNAAVQKAFIDINEEGAEAAASNMIGITFHSFQPASQYETFIADHPFVFYLYNKKDVLFSGVFHQ